MWLHDRIGCGTRVQRADNPRHTGRVDSIAGVATGMPNLIAGATYRVTWDNGWREDVPRSDLEREADER